MQELIVYWLTDRGAWGSVFLEAHAMPAAGSRDILHLLATVPLHLHTNHTFSLLLLGNIDPEMVWDVLSKRALTLEPWFTRFDSYSHDLFPTLALLSHYRGLTSPLPCATLRLVSEGALSAHGTSESFLAGGSAPAPPRRLPWDTARGRLRSLDDVTRTSGTSSVPPTLPGGDKVVA